MDRTLAAELQAKLVSCEVRLQRCEERNTAGQLAVEMIHDLRNPLEALGNLIYLSVMEAQKPDTVRRYLHEAEEQMATLRDLVGHSLSFARRQDAFRHVKLAGVAQAALRIHRQAIAAKEVRLVQQLPEGPSAAIHPGEMLQVVSNLIANALDALPSGGTLHLRLRKRHGKVEFVVADNGHGIPMEHASLIFEPFFTTRGEKGTGLGLALSSRIVDRHHGKIRMRSSVRPGRSGTTFVISLPAGTA